MPATQESIADQLRELDTRIALIKEGSGDPSELLEQKATLLEQFERVNESLNEGTKLLKG